MTGSVSRSWSRVVGMLMIIYVLVGGMKGTTWVQIVKAFLLIGGAIVMTIWVLAINGFSLNTLLESAVAASATDPKDAILAPGLQYGKNPWDFISLSIALVLGTAGLPHVLMRFYTVPTAKEARRSVVWAIWLIGIFYLLTLVLGYGAASLVGPEKILGSPGGVNSAAPLLALALGGPLLLGFISAVAFATILAVVAGLTITAAASFAHDIYANVIKKGNVPPDGEVKVARRTVIVIGVARDHRRHRRAGAEHRLPRRARVRGGRVGEPADDPLLAVLAQVPTRGAVWSMYGGLAAAVILIFLSPVFWGTETSVFKNVGVAIWPLNNPGIVSIPHRVLPRLARLGRRAASTENQALAAEMDVRSLTGFGAEKATNH